MTKSEIMKERWKNSDFRRKMTESRMGHIVTFETRQKIGAANTGKKRTDEIKRLYSEKSWQRGKPAWNRKEYNYLPYFCDCGCGGICNRRNRFITGHNFSGKYTESNPWKVYKNRHENGNPGSEKVKKLWEDSSWKKEIVKKIFKASHVRPNYKESVLDGLIQLVRPKEFLYVGDGSVIIEGKCPDWINVNGKKQIIELFGRFWHPPEDEEKRKVYFSKYGYEVLVVWEFELSNFERLFEKIRGF
jgi:hypothetical protein